MSEREPKPEAIDRSFINQHEPDYLDFWTKELGINQALLLQLIGRYGVMTAAIRKAIDDSRESR